MDMNNTAFLIVSADRVNRDRFDSMLKCKGKTFPFLINFF